MFFLTQLFWASDFYSEPILFIRYLGAADLPGLSKTETWLPLRNIWLLYWDYYFTFNDKIVSPEMNSTADPLDMTYKINSSAPVRDSLPIAFTKNFIAVLVWFIFSYISGCILLTFLRNQTFYEDPRYILFIHMVINDAAHLTLTMMLNLLSYIFYKINVSFCAVFMLLAVFTTSSTPLNLAGMAIERYIAVCHPLHHSQICTVRRTYILIGLIWVVGITSDITDLFVTLAMEPNSFFHSAVFCLRQNVFKDPSLTYKRQAFDILFFLFVFLTLVYTYLRVLFAARALSADKLGAKRARKTILLHGVQLLMCLLSYINPSVEFVLLMFVPGHISAIRYSTYLIIYILPRCLSPIIYGVRDEKFRRYLSRYIISGQCRVPAVREHQERRVTPGNTQ
ncbi:odorant receptor 131-2-like [Lepisosteus oculatus]|uniref:odorant receptor 131-2-like n=1 Tax=Lepisosteus oculatus TaxID=7918 RepID=UPI0035F50955